MPQTGGSVVRLSFPLDSATRLRETENQSRQRVAHRRQPSAVTTDRWAVCQRYGRNCEPLGPGKCSAANECVNGSQRRYPFAARKRRGLAYDVELGLERSAYPNVLEHQERAEAVGCRREQTAMPDTFSSATECRTVQPAATIDER